MSGAEIDSDEKTAEIDFDEKTAEGFPIWRCWRTKKEWFYRKNVLDFNSPEFVGVENWANLDREEKKVYIRRFRRTEITIRRWKFMHCLQRPEIYGLKPYGPGSKGTLCCWRYYAATTRLSVTTHLVIILCIGSRPGEMEGVL
jgi:hypothetical protein